MIDEIILELDGRKYEWMHDSAAGSPDNCWTWSDVQSSMKPSSTIIAQLNRRFIDAITESMADDLARDEVKRFEAILRSMGAKDSDFDRPGLDRILKIAKPERFREHRFERLPSNAHSPFNCRELRDWVFGKSTVKAFIPSVVTCLGDGPFEFEDFVSFLASRNISHNSIPPGHLILGREGWEESEVDSAIDEHRGKSLRIYSQEMFVVMLTYGLDPFSAPADVPSAFRAGHPGLMFVSAGWVGWVNTQVPYEGPSRSTRKASPSGSPSQSPLHAMGYRVGRQGLSSGERRSILGKAFSGGLPHVENPEYMSQWGEPGSPERLRKMANDIAANCRNMKRRRNRSDQAIKEWESDLEWLEQTYYRGHFQFSWPRTSV
jgi:hypothetical protein